MKNNKEYWGKTRRRTLGLIMLVGCMILFGVFELSAESDLKDAQKRVDEAYRDEQWWAKAAMLNTACSGKFSSDRTIEEYVRDIWHLDKVKVEL